jgi:hypothetical protein
MGEWDATAKLTVPDGASSDRLAYSGLGIAGDTVVARALFRGAAYVAALAD